MIGYGYLGGIMDSAAVAMVCFTGESCADWQSRGHRYIYLVDMLPGDLEGWVTNKPIRFTLSGHRCK